MEAQTRGFEKEGGVGFEVVFGNEVAEEGADAADEAAQGARGEAEVDHGYHEGMEGIDVGRVG